MPLASGTRLGPYEIGAPLGAGGMGEVYRARDTKLNRDVALKVLPDSFAGDPDRLARFTREAQTLASLNHPNIAHIHGLEESNGVRALVMELVEGDELTALIGRSPMPLADVLPIAKQIAEALEAAHDIGIVHRDLKPANIKVRKDGTVKVLDFGLAKAMDSTGDSAANAANSPTLSVHMTVAGVILGTAAYMSPEQARGKHVDKRADIWAFGVVLYEMLTGQQAFTGDTITDIIAAVVTREPDWAAIPVSTPVHIRHLLARCLEKDPKRRLRDIGEARMMMDGNPSATPVVAAPTTSARTSWPLVAAITVMLLMLIVNGIMFWQSRRLAPPATPVPSRFAITLPPDQTFTRSGRHLIAVSPDGTNIAYVANNQLFLRPLNALAATAILGSANTDPSEPVFSPDGQWIAFWTANELKKVPVSGGTPVAIAAASNPFGLSWEGDDLLYASDQSPPSIIAQPVNGSARRVLIELAKTEVAQSPHFVGDGKAVLFSLLTGNAQEWGDASIVVQELASGKRTELVKGGTDARLLPTGHLVYAHDSTLLAVPFDASRMAIRGSAVPVGQDVQPGLGGFTGATQAVWSATGTMVYVPNTMSGRDRDLIWIDRQGKIEKLPVPSRPYWSRVRVSPDGKTIAVRISGAAASEWDISLIDVATGTDRRLTFSGSATDPVWTADGKRVCYVSHDEFFCQAADGSGQPQRLFQFKGLSTATAISPDGQSILFEANTESLRDIVIAGMAPGASPRVLVHSPAEERAGVVSPDGRWIAYNSAESGSDQVFVRPFPAVDQGRWLVTPDNGQEPRWSADGRELFFVTYGTGGTATNASMMSVPVLPGATFTIGKPVKLATAAVGSRGGFDVGRDGRFLMSVPSSTGNGQLGLVVVQNWFEELKARVPTHGRE